MFDENNVWPLRDSRQHFDTFCHRYKPEIAPSDRLVRVQSFIHQYQTVNIHCHDFSIFRATDEERQTLDMRSTLIFYLSRVLTWLKQVFDGRMAFNLKLKYENNKKHWYDGNWKKSSSEEKLSHKIWSTVTTLVKDGIMSSTNEMLSGHRLSTCYCFYRGWNGIHIVNE